MKNRILRTIVLGGLILVAFARDVLAQESGSLTTSFPRKFVHGVRVEGRPEYVFPTSSFLRGENPEGKIIRGAFSSHVKYILRYRPESPVGRVYGDVYQGIGFGYYTLGEPDCLGNPLAFYLFQGARIARLSSRLSFHYEWNLGLSSGWKPYDYYDNSFNTMIGSKVNAYINANFYFRWEFIPGVSLISGVTLSHFSNGNTRIPNGGLNSIGGNFGLEYDFYRKKDRSPLQEVNGILDLASRRHVSYDFVFFGSWHQQLMPLSDGYAPSPEYYPVFGFNFAPMYNLNYRFRFGLSLDGTYDGGANLYTKNDVYGEIDKSEILRPDLSEQFSLGLSARAEYVMPFFTLGVGMGTNFIGKGDTRMFYQILALKIAISRSAFLHVGYNLREFSEPNYLMLGVGFHLNGKYMAF